jgi:curved DNA-binding protein CbpA
MGEHSSENGGERARHSAPDRSWYEVLEIPRHASGEEIEAAYRRALRLIEGQTLGGYLMLDPDAQQSARHDVETAFRVLTDPQRRARFDRELDAGGEAEAEAGEADQEGHGRRKSGLSPAAQDAPESEPDDAPTLPVAPADSLTEEDRPLAEASTLRPSGRQRPSLVRFLSPVEDRRKLSPHAVTEPPAARRAPPSPTARRVWVYGESNVEGVADRAHVKETSQPEGRWPSEVDERTLPPEGEINGGVIRRLREARGITLADLADQTHIGTSYLRAIEEQELDDLPARVYLRGFLTQIGRVLKVDKNRLAEGYLTFVERYKSR